MSDSSDEIRIIWIMSKCQRDYQEAVYRMIDTINQFDTDMDNVNKQVNEASDSFKRFTSCVLKMTWELEGGKNDE